MRPWSHARPEGHGTGPGFNFEVPQSGLHHHLDWFLTAEPDGSRDDAIYLLPLEFYLLDSGGSVLATSDPIYSLSSQNRADIHDAVIDIVAANIVPEPASLALAVAGGGLLMRRRR